jgi:hypothetical protein
MPTAPSELLVPVSIGELIDKITILEIKLERIADPAKRANIGAELAALRATQARHGLDGAELDALMHSLRAVNLELWEIEDAIRVEEHHQRFGEAFIALARSVYIKNDRRAELKRRINVAFHSVLREEKSYAHFGAAAEPEAP